MTDFVPFALPDVGEREIAAVGDAIRSGWLTSGPLVKNFETAFAESIAPGLSAIAVSSATAGLHLALEACGVSPGDEVLVPTWTFTSTAEVVRYLGAVPVLVDVDKSTLNIDLEAAERAVTPRTVAIMPVHFAGRPVSAKLLGDFAARHGLKVVEDAAHAFPASSGDVVVGASSSDAVVFSFYATKSITTGEGGMVVTRDPALAARMKVMRLHGISRDAFDRYRSTVPSWSYDVVAAGFKYNLTDPSAAMGLVQLSRAEDMRARRQEIAAYYTEALTDCGVELPPEPSAADRHAWHLYVVRTAQDDDRDRFIDELATHGIGTSVHFIPLHQHPFWRAWGGYELHDFPVASAEYKRVVSLPIYSRMSDADVERVAACVRASIRC